MMSKSSLVSVQLLLISLLMCRMHCDVSWPLKRPENMPSIKSLEVMCGKDHMDVNLQFTQPFEGVVSSKGQHSDPRCVYVPAMTRNQHFQFRIAYSRCGTKPDLNKQFYENTIVIQYDKDLLEVWDEAKRLRCEWFNDYEKVATKPPLVITDLDVVQLDFRGDNVDCWMEIQRGFGPWAPPVNGIVPLGSNLTLVIAVNDHKGEFDMRVKSCQASDGQKHIIKLSNDVGCVLRPKMISSFYKIHGTDDRSSVLVYAFFHAFKFPDSLSVHIKCNVEICRHGCLPHCPQNDNSKGGGNKINGHLPSQHPILSKNIPYPPHQQPLRNQPHLFPPKRQPSLNPLLDFYKKIDNRQDIVSNDLVSSTSQTQFPYGPRSFESTTHTLEASPRNARKKRTISVQNADDQEQTNVGLSGLYEVISEVDLAYNPFESASKLDGSDGGGTPVTIFKGTIKEEIVYGTLCLSVAGFSFLFVFVASSAVIAAFLAGSLLYRYQIQRENRKLFFNNDSYFSLQTFSTLSNLIPFRSRHNLDKEMD